MKNKLNFRGKVILCFIMIVYTILYGVNAYSSNSLTGSYNCYQNLANVSTSCGGLNTGTYLNPGLWSDGDFVTYSILDGSSDWEVNYSKNTSFIGAIVNTERYSGSGYAYYNYTIPSSCFNAYTDKINLKFYRGSSGSFYTIEGACWNGNSYTSLFSDTGKIKLAEVSMYWDSNQTSENLTFTNNSNITRYLSVPQNTILTNGFMNLSGYNYTSYTGLCFQYKSNVSTIGDGDCNLNYSGNYTSYPYSINAPSSSSWNFTYNKPSNYLNETPTIWMITTRGGSSTYYTNLTIPKQCLTTGSLKLNFKFNCFFSDGYQNFSCYNSSNEWNLIYNNNCYGNMIYWSDESVYWNSTFNKYYPTNPSIFIGSNNVFTQSGIYNISNQTSNLANSINNYLTTCAYSNGVCQVPFIFHSDTAGILQYSNLIFNNSGFTQNSITYDSITSGGSTETFTLNLTYDTYNTNSVLANLIYNNTAYSTVITNYGTYQLATSTIPIPRVNYQTNKSFYFSITLNGIVYNSSTNNQTINTFTIDNCSTNTLNIMNISMVDEETLNPINGTIEGLFNIYSLNGNNLITTLNQTFNYVIGTPTRICLTNFTSNYSMSYQLRFYGNSSYFKRYKVIQNQVLSNTTFNNLILYNLLTSMGYPFTITVTGNLQTTNGNTGLLVDAQRQYFSSNSYNSVESQVTDNNGIAIINLVPNNVIYNFVVSYNNQILGTFNNYQVQCSNPSIGQCTLILNLGQAQATIPNYQNYGNIEGSYYLNSNTSTLFFQFNSIDGNSHNVNQSVIEFDGYGNTTICSNYASGTSGTLICNIPTLYQNTTFYSTIYSDGVYIGTNYFTLGQTTNYYGVDIFIELLMFSSIVMLMLANPILMVIGTILGFASGLTLLWVTGGSWQSILGVVIAFAIGGCIIIYKIGRKI